MAIDLLSVIRDDSAIKTKGFTGAIFLTYSLNLTFFEQILAPALDEAGCSNVLILADPDGYQQALDMGAKSINGVGVRYVCVPVRRKGNGIQHGKMLFMVGPNNGRLLIGSGNLTFHGYGRNLELYSIFNRSTSSSSIDSEPFHEAWNLIQKLVSDVDMPVAVQQQISAINEKVDWLRESSTSIEPIVWHNYERSILDQLIDWRKNNGFVGPAKSVHAISPYYDQHLVALKKIASDLSPTKLNIYLDPNLTNLDGKTALQEWRGKSPKLESYSIKAGEKQASFRHVHAKAIVGKEKNGSWIISGSANLSRPALLTSWQSGGNLEVITFFRSDNPKEFDYLLDDEMVKVNPINLASVTITESAPSEKEIANPPDVTLVDLYLRGEKIIGRLSNPFSPDGQKAILHLLRRNEDLPVRFLDGVSFEARLKLPLKEEAESARLVSELQFTPYHWIDQPEVLARHGSRSYQSQLKGKIQSLLGAEKLFRELMDFLWDRVEPDLQKDEHNPANLRRHRNRRNQDQGSASESQPPGPDAFVTNEDLIESINDALDYHQPYDRSLLSLQDLFSLVLLRLTARTQVLLVEDDLSDEDLEEKTQEDQGQEKIDILQNLSNYLIRYCNRYSERLVDDEFIKKTSPELIFQNHFTLCKVLLEFENKARDFGVFDREDLFICFWKIWAPLACPDVVGLHGDPALSSLNKTYQPVVVQNTWQSAGMPELAVYMFCEVLGQPPNWRTGLWQPDNVETFMFARKWISSVRKILSDNAFFIQSADVEKIIGIQSVDDLFNFPTVDADKLEYSKLVFKKIEDYQYPVEEKYSPLINLYNPKKPINDPVERQKFVEEVYKAGLAVEFDKYQLNPKPILPTKYTEGEVYCSRCGAEQTENAIVLLERGELVLCTFSKDAWMYLRPHLLKTIF